MHEIPNLPFPSLHEPEQSQPSQSAGQVPESKANTDKEDSLRANRED
jgi:hypothetical protein